MKENHKPHRRTNWKERSVVVPSPSRIQTQWHNSFTLGLTPWRWYHMPITTPFKCNLEQEAVDKYLSKYSATLTFWNGSLKTVGPQKISTMVFQIQSLNSVPGAQISHRLLEIWLVATRWLCLIGECLLICIPSDLGGRCTWKCSVGLFACLGTVYVCHSG